MRIYDKRRSGVFYSEHAVFDQWGWILGAHRLAIYLCVVSHAGYTTREGFPSYATVASKCGMSRRKAIDCISDLTFLGFLEKESRETEKGDPDSNNYSLLDIPDVETAANSILNNLKLIPKNQQWVIEKFNEYLAQKRANNTLKKSVINASIEQVNSLENSDVVHAAQQVAGGGVVHDIHHPSASHALGVVHAVHQGSACCAPEINTYKDTQPKDTHLHTPITPELLKFDFNLRNLDEAERMYVCNELNKLEREDTEGRLRDAQTILDEANYKRDRIKLSLTVYVKGLVTKANKGNFTPTHNLNLRRKKKALEAEKAVQAMAQQKEQEKRAVEDTQSISDMPEFNQLTKAEQEQVKAEFVKELETQKGAGHALIRRFYQQNGLEHKAVKSMFKDFIKSRGK